MHLYIATSNPGKLRDFAHAAATFPDITLTPLPNLKSIPEPAETAKTFAGNALIKALAYGALAPNDIVIADDSGISVPALGGDPGVRSARYADDQHFTGPGTQDERNLTCLLDRAADLEQREAHYVCALAAVRNGQLLATGSGELQGHLIKAPRGTKGFGYDPVFEVLAQGQQRTMAELDPTTRINFSHRARAFVDLLQQLA